jgi:hypothetical protein
MVKRRNLNEIVGSDLRRLGVRSRVVKSSRVKVADHELSSSRVVPEGAEFVQLVGTTEPGRRMAEPDLRLAAALLDRVPVLAVLQRDSIAYVRMPGWVLAFLLRVVSECDPSKVQTLLNEYLPLGVMLPKGDQNLGSSIMSALEETESSSHST